ncbi:uncharacterized protein LOC128557467 [Mercenaria mercenaria]|uniref:uncharacterized protein LOC128557467 n=1 Tax=Mercenaria mercenaria TaxID=6596 RepID=UPI00234F8A48|nr:uncharacterized protein LOC128557467 [Mercenaria mercenaria]
MFADDTTISASGKTVSDVQIVLQEDLTIVENWCKDNAMIPNAEKTKAMFLSASNKIHNTFGNNNSLEFTLNQQKLETVHEEKLLGIQVDQNLNWKNQIDKILKKCNSLLYLLLRIKFCLNLHSRKLFYNAYILPHLDYCSTIWGNCNSQLQNDLIKFQKRAARILLDKPFDTPSNELFKELHWMTFPERVDYKKAVTVYKALQTESQNCPDYLKNKFKYVNNNKLRSSQQQLLYIPKPNLEFFRKSLNYSGPKLWNDIPLHVRSSASSTEFKRRYIQWKFPGWTN